MLVDSTAGVALKTSVTAGPMIQLPTVNSWPIHFVLFCQAPQSESNTFLSSGWHNC